MAPKRLAAFTLHARSPTPTEYRKLIKAVGWERYSNLRFAPVALANSLHCVVACESKRGKVIGLGRIVGDRARFFYIQDLVVRPEFQGQGIGTAILDALFAWLNRHAPRKAYIGLFATKAHAKFYRQWGFQGPDDFLYGMCVKKFSRPLTRPGSPVAGCATSPVPNVPRRRAH